MTAFLGLVATGCVSPDDPGVRINPLSADLVFGAKKENTQVKGLQDSSPLPEEIIYEESYDEEEIEEAPAPRRRTAFVREEAVIEPDLPPEPFVCYPYFTQPAPRGEPEAIVKKKPLAGLMHWNTYEVITGSGSDPVVTPLTGNRRLITDVKDIEPSEVDAANKAVQESPLAGFDVPEFGSALFTFKSVTPFGENFLVSTYQVGPPFVTPNTVQNVFRVSDAVYRPRPPDAGVVLKKTEVVNAAGEPVAGFAPFVPTVGLMLLPLPATATERFLSVAVDTTTGKTVRYDGVVNGIQRINACGEPIDGWSVSIAVLVSTPGETYDDAVGNPCITKNSTTQSTSFPRCFQYDVMIAPQHGGILISEAVVQTPAQGLRSPEIPVGKQTFPTNCDQPPAPTTTTTGTGPTTTTTSTSSTTSTTLPVTPPTAPPACVVASSTTIPGQVIVPPDEGGRFETQRIIGTLDPEPYSGDLTELRQGRTFE